MLRTQGTLNPKGGGNNRGFRVVGLNSLKGALEGTIVRVIKGHTLNPNPKPLNPKTLPGV